MNHPRARGLLVATLVPATLSACSGGINAGEKGGTAFIVLTVMLLAIAGVLYLALGRGE